MKPVHTLIDKRWSPRAFSDKPIEKEKLQIIFEAARRSPSSSNEQPWRYLVGIKGEGDIWDKIFSVLDEGNQEWAGKAPVLIIVLAKETFTSTGNKNNHALYDAGQSIAYLSLQATSEGLFVHQMAGFFPENVVSLFLIPDDYKAITAVAIGYKGNPEHLSEKNKASESQRIIRKDLIEIVFKKWNEALNF